MFKLRYWLLSIMRIELIVFLVLYIGLGCMLIYYWDFAIGLSLFMIGLIILFILMFIKLYSIITNFMAITERQKNELENLNKEQFEDAMAHIEDLSSKRCD